MATLVKIQFNKKFNFWEALTAFSINKENTKFTKYGNDFNINAQTKDLLIEKINNFNFNTTFKIV